MSLSDNQGFQFTPFGIIGLGQQAPLTSQEFAGATVDVGVAEQLATAQVAEPLAAAPRKQVAPSSHAAVAKATVSAIQNPRDLVKAAKARVKEIRSELKRMKALQRELAELERLLDAAKRPVAAVRDINSRRVG